MSQTPAKLFLLAVECVRCLTASVLVSENRRGGVAMATALIGREYDSPSELSGFATCWGPLYILAQEEGLIHTCPPVVVFTCASPLFVLPLLSFPRFLKFLVDATTVARLNIPAAMCVCCVYCVSDCRTMLLEGCFGLGVFMF